MTPWPETVASASGATKRVALGVTMTRTSAPASRRRRTRSGVLYAAIPPVTPRTIFMVAMLPSCPATGQPGNLFGFQRRRLFNGRRELPLHLGLVDLFHRHARRLGVFALHLRRGSLNELLCAFGNEQHIPELAIHALGQSFHFALPP